MILSTSICRAFRVAMFLFLSALSVGCVSLAGAVRADDLPATKLLLAEGRKPDDGELGIAITKERSLAIVMALVEAGADVNDPNVQDDGWTVTPLQAAARHGQRQVVEYLLLSGADPFARVKTTWLGPLIDGTKLDMPLPAWLAYAHRTFAFDTGGPRGDVDGVLASILELVEAKHGRERVIAYVNERDQFGWTALHLAAFSNDPHMTEALLKAGARPDVLAPTRPYRFALKGALPPNEEMTPLQIAVRRNAQATAAVLLSGGADPLARSKSGLTAQEMVEKMRREDEENAAFWAGVSQGFGEVLRGANMALQQQAGPVTNPLDDNGFQDRMKAIQREEAAKKQGRSSGSSITVSPEPTREDLPENEDGVSSQERSNPPRAPEKRSELPTQAELKCTESPPAKTTTFIQSPTRDEAKARVLAYPQEFCANSGGGRLVSSNCHDLTFAGYVECKVTVECNAGRKSCDDPNIGAVKQ